MELAQELISIIMPAYNSEKYIAQSIDSVLAQTWKNWELIVVDDASSDHTCDVVELYVSQYPQIQLIKNRKNQGAAQARNIGIHQAKGQWIAFLDSDDCWMPQKLEKQIIVSRSTASDFLFTGSEFMDETGKRLAGRLSVPSVISYRQLLKQNVISCSSVLIKKELLILYPMEGNNLHEDFSLWLKILRDCKISATGIDEPLIIYRINSSSKSGNKKKSALMTYRVYRSLGLNPGIALYYWCWYVYLSLRKYKKIYHGKND